MNEINHKTIEKYHEPIRETMFCLPLNTNPHKCQVCCLTFNISFCSVNLGRHDCPLESGLDCISRIMIHNTGIYKVPSLTMRQPTPSLI